MKAEVAWPPRAARPPVAAAPSISVLHHHYPARYILRWQAGHLVSILLTNLTSASIPLLHPEASLCVEVSVLGSSLVSAPLTISPPGPSYWNQPNAAVATSKTSPLEGSKAAVTMPTAAKVALTVSVVAMVVLLAVLAILVAVLRRVTARPPRAAAAKDGSFLDHDAANRTAASTHTLIRFENFLEKNRLSHIHLT